MASRHRSHNSLSARGSQRPDSRASTTSAASHHNDLHTSIGQQNKSADSAYLSAGPEAALLQYQASMVPHPASQYEMPPQNAPYNHANPAGSYAVPANYGSQEAPFVPQDNGYHNNHARVGSVPPQSSTELPEDKRKKGSAITATNDRELREMLARNEGRPLKDVAQEVIQKERTPMAEKTKQLFAMLWLKAVCKPAKTSVPRNRVYSQYANRCGTERVIPLNPASFGKLVRVIFPGIQTRRLGVRGESKYHYVDLALGDDSPNMPLSGSWANNGFHTESRQRSQSASAQQIDFSNIPRLQADTAAFPTNDGSFDVPSPQPATPRGPASKAQAFAYPETRGVQSGSAEALTYPHVLRFPSSNLPTFSESEPVNLPSIQPFLPPRTDQDTAEALFALYRTHCTSLIDSIRFCKEKQFFRLYTSFHGTLTVPVQKLFTHANMAPWIEQCDLVMYRTMVRFVSRLTLQAAPVVVINILSNISGNLYGHIAKTFATQPAHVLEAKLRPATVFASLLYRLIRVNQSAHAAANLLTIDQNREQMWREWTTMVNPKRVMEAELPDCGYEEVYKILTSEMRSLLEPLQSPAYHDDPYNFNAYNFEENGSFAAFLQSQTAGSAPASRNGTANSNGTISGSGVSTDTVLDRWSHFISSLATRFPHASARTLLHCISAVGTAALRDITIMNGLSYGHWWVLKIFVDEMSLWLAEMGGFLEPTLAEMMGEGGQAGPGQQGLVGMGSRPETGGTDASFLGQQQQQPSLNMFPQYRHHHQHSQHEAEFDFSRPPSSHHHQQMPAQRRPLSAAALKQQRHAQQQQHDTDVDDSGIGMSLVEEDLSLSRFGGGAVQAG